LKEEKQQVSELQSRFKTRKQELHTKEQQFSNFQNEKEREITALQQQIAEMQSHFRSNEEQLRRENNELLNYKAS